MRATTLSLNLLLATVLAALAAYYAFTTIRVGGIHSSNLTSAQIIRQRCPIRLVQPEWVSSQPDMLMNWLMAETRARLGLVGVVWLGGVNIIVWRHLKSRKNIHPANDEVCG